MSTSCEGNCDTKGWRLLTTEMDSGIGHGGEASIQLNLTVNVCYFKKLIIVIR